MRVVVLAVGLAAWTIAAPAQAQERRAAAVNDRARALFGADLSELAVQHLRGAIERGEADAETHYLLATSLRAEANALRAEAARAGGANAARLRDDADASEAEALRELALGRRFAQRIVAERLQAGDLDGVRRMAAALLRADPGDARALEALRTVGDEPGLAGASSVSATPWDEPDPRPRSGKAVAPAPKAAAAPRPRPPAPAPARPAPPRRVEATGAEVEVLARIVKGEAPRASFDGKVAIAAVVLNRLRTPGFPKTIRGVAHQPGQFRCYDPDVRSRLYAGPIPPECLAAARAALAGKDPTEGATYLFAHARRPAWAKDMQATATIGDLEFCRPR